MAIPISDVIALKETLNTKLRFVANQLLQSTSSEAMFPDPVIIGGIKQIFGKNPEVSY